MGGHRKNIERNSWSKSRNTLANPEEKIPWQIEERTSGDSLTTHVKSQVTRRHWICHIDIFLRFFLSNVCLYNCNCCDSPEIFVRHFLGITKLPKIVSRNSECSYWDFCNSCSRISCWDFSRSISWSISWDNLIVKITGRSVGRICSEILRGNIIGKLRKQYREKLGHFDKTSGRNPRRNFGEIPELILKAS